MKNRKQILEGTGSLSRFFQVFMIGASGAGLAVFLFLFFFKVVRFDLLFRVVYINPEITLPWVVPAAGALLLLLPALKKQSRWLEKTAWAFFPAPLLILQSFFDPGYWSLLGGILITGITAFRFFSLWKFPGIHIPRQWGMIGAVFIYSCCAVLSFRLQLHAFNALYLIYGDWGQYADHYLMLSRGEGRLIDWAVGGGHWNPGINLLMSGLFYFFPAPETIFAVNSLIIYSIIPLGYLLCRRLGFSVFQALLLSCTAALNPCLSHQSTSFVYGFHPIVFLIPAVLLFFIFKAAKNVPGMIICFILSLTIQETVTIFWGGYGLYLLCSGKKLRGISLMFAMMLCFLLISMAVIPAAFSGNGGYTQLFHYSELGASPAEILMSAVLKPEVFWGKLFHISSCGFVSTLLLPFLGGVLFYPAAAVTGLPLLTGICLQGGAELKCIMFQYGVELTLIMYLTAVSGMMYLLKERICRVWYFITGTVNRRRLYCGAAAAMLVMSYFSFVLYGMGPWTKGGYDAIMEMRDAGKLTSYLNAITADASRIMTNSRMRPHFQYTQPTLPISDKFSAGDVIIVNLADGKWEREGAMADLVRRISRNPKVRQVNYVRWENSTWGVFKVL